MNFDVYNRIATDVAQEQDGVILLVAASKGEGNS